MAKTWGIAQFYGMGSMQYLLDSGVWLADCQLFDGFESMIEADAHAQKLHQDGQPHGVQFTVDKQGKVLTARRKN
jgi:hypothetical protein